MCGIIALLSLINSNSNNIQLLDGLKQLQNRGYDSAGICTLTNNFNLIKYSSQNNYSAIQKLEENIEN